MLTLSGSPANSDIDNIPLNIRRNKSAPLKFLCDLHIDGATELGYVNVTNGTLQNVTVVNITAGNIAERALNYQVVMFFAGHARTNEQFLPRYEFIQRDKPVADDIIRVLTALRA